MAIVIDSERPHACWACDYRCGLNIIARTEEEGIPDDCPIIGEIPDVHGRLIDADLCLEKFKLYCQDCKKEIDCYSCWVSDTFDVVKGIPTVLEATE